MNSRSRFSKKVVSLIGRTSTNEPGKKARKAPTDTVKPPRTLPVITPIIVASFSKAVSSSNQALFFFALSRERRVAPRPSSNKSNATSTSSPIATSNSPLLFKNCHFGMTPSDFECVLTITISFSISITVPINIAPGLILVLVKLSSSNSAKLSLIILFPKFVRTQTNLFFIKVKKNHTQCAVSQ